MGCGGGAIVTVAVSAARDHGLGSPDFIRMTPTPTPWTYMDSFAGFRAPEMVRNRALCE